MAADSKKISPDNNFTHFVKSYERLPDNAKNIASLFLIKNGERLEFVKKHSFCGCLASFIARVKRFFCSSSDLDAERVFSTAITILNGKSSTNIKTEEEIRSLLGNLRDRIVSNSRRRFKTKELKDKYITTLQTFNFQREIDSPHDPDLSRPLVGTTSKTSDLVNTILQPGGDLYDVIINAFDIDKRSADFSEEFLRPIVLFVRSCENSQKIITDLSVKDTQSFIASVIKNLDCVGEHKDKFLKLIQQKPKISSRTFSSDSELTIKHCAFVFGNSFLKDSGLEGDVSSVPFVELLRQFVDSKVDSGQGGHDFVDANALKRMQLTLRENVIDLRGVVDHEKIKGEFLAKLKGPETAILLLGGWLNHAVIFEIRGQSDGKYTINVFNRGGGDSFNTRETVGFREKTEGCLSVINIDKTVFQDRDMLSQLEFLMMMKSLDDEDDKLKNSPESILYNLILPAIGTIITRPLWIEELRMLEPQRSGICVYAGLYAWMIYQTINKEKFKYEFYRFVAELLCKQVEKECLIDMQADHEYEKIYRDRAVLERCVSKYSGWVNKHFHELHREMDKDEIIRKLQSVLFAVDQRLKAFEKQHKDSLLKGFYQDGNGTPKARGMTLQSWSYPFAVDHDVVANEMISPRFFLLQRGRELLNLIQKITDPKQEGVIDAVLQMLADEKNICRDTEFFYLVQELFRKIGGSTTDWEQVNFANSKTSFEALCSITKRIMFFLQQEIKYSNLFPWAERYLSYLAIQFGLECAYKKLTPEEGGCVLVENFQSVLTYIGDEYVRCLETTDPFWIKFKLEILKLIESNKKVSGPFSDFLIKNLSHEDRSFKINLRSLVPCLSRWYNSYCGEDKKRLIRESIEKDRETQRSEKNRLSDKIKKEIAEIERAVNLLSKNIESLSRQGREGLVALKKLDELRGNLSETNNKFLKKKQELACVSEEVDRDQRYWPKGVESDNDFLMKVIFVNQKKEKAAFSKNHDFIKTILPDAFFNLARSSMVSIFLFFKKNYNCGIADNFEDNTGITFLWGDGDRLSIIINYEDILAERQDKLRNKYDRYLPSVKGEQLLFLRSDKCWDDRVLECEIPEKEHRLRSQLGYPRDKTKAILATKAATAVEAISALDYFRSNISDLTKRDNVVLLHYLLFRNELVFEGLKDKMTREHFISASRAFFSSAINFCMDTKEVNAAAHLFWIGSLVQEEIDFIYSQDNLPPQKIMEDELVFSLIDRSLNDPSVVEHRPVLFESVLASSKNLFVKNPKSLTDIDKKRIGYAFFTRLASKAEPVNGENDGCLQKDHDRDMSLAELENFVVTAAPNLRMELVVNFVLPLLIKAFPNLNICGETKVSENEHNVFHVEEELLGSGNEMKFCFLSGEIWSSKRDAFISKSYLTREEIKLLKKTSLFTNDYDFSRVAGFERTTTTGCKYFQFLDPVRGFEYCIERSLRLGDCYAVGYCYYVKFKPFPSSDAIWTKVIPSNEMRFLFSNSDDVDFLKSFLFLSKDKNKVFVCDPQNYNVLYIASTSDSTGGNIVPKLVDKDVQEEEWLTLTTRKVELFHHFEDYSYIMHWSDVSNRLRRIDFRRYNISLFYDDEQEKWILSGQDEWHLAKDQFVPYLGVTTGFLLFENDVGEKKVLLPIRDCHIDRTEKHSLNFSYAYDYSHKGKNIHLAEFSLEAGSDTLKPKNLVSLLHIARIYLEKGFMDQAEELLFSAQAESLHEKFSPPEEEIIKKIFMLPASGSSEARIIRLRMRAFAILAKNYFQFRSSVHDGGSNFMGCDRSFNFSQMLTLVENYLLHRSSIILPDHNDELVIHKALLEEPSLQEERKKLPMIDQLTKRQPKFTEVMVRPPDVSDIKELLRKRYEEKFLPEVIRYVYSVEFPKSKEDLDRLPSIACMVRRYLDGLFDFRGNKISKLPSDIVEKAGKKYAQERSKGKFPFDCHKCTFVMNETDKEGLFLYAEALVNESKATNYEKAKETGLLYVLCHMAFFRNDDESVTKVGIICLTHLLILNQGKKPLVVKPYKLAIADRPEVEKPLESVSDLQSLEGLEQYKTFTANHTIDMKDFLTKQSRQSAREEHKIENLFEKDLVRQEVEDSESIKSQFVKMSEGLKAAAVKPDREEVFLPKDGGPSLREFSDSLMAKKVEEEHKLSAVSQAITVAVCSAIQRNEQPYLQVTSSERKLPTIDDIVVLAIRKDFDKRMDEFYPEISSIGRQKLLSAVRTYLIQKTFCQHLGRAVNLCHQLCKEPDMDMAAKKILLNDLGSLMESGRAYEFSDEHAPIFLFLEVTLNIRLREEQIRSILDYAKYAKDKNPMAMQMIMGFGKTSVIQPTLAYLFSLMAYEDGALSTVMVPEALFGKVKDDLSKVLGSMFGQLVIVLPYDRYRATMDETRIRREFIERTKHAWFFGSQQKMNLVRDLFKMSYLSDFEEQLKIGGNSGRCLLTTPKEKQSLLTSLYEAYFDLSQQPDDLIVQERVNIISRICKYMQLHQVMQIDEIDSTQNPNVIFQYPVGDQRPIDYDQAFVVSDMVIGIASSLQGISLDFCTKFQQRINPGYVKPTTSLTEEIFQDRVIPILLEQAHKSLRAIVRDYDTKMNIVGKQVLDNFLLEADCDRSKMVEKIDKAFSDRRDRDLIGAAARAICHIFPDTFFMNPGVNFGSDTKELMESERRKTSHYFAVPYGASNSPRKTRFADNLKTVALSAKLVACYQIPLDVSREMLNEMRKSITGQMRGAKVACNETTAGKLFLEIMRDESVDILKKEDFSIDEVKAFQAAASRNDLMIHKFLREYVYPQIIEFSQCLSCSPQVPAGSSALSFGYTGTLQDGTLPLFMGCTKSPGVACKIIKAIQSKMISGTSQVKVFDKESSPIEQIVDGFSRDKDLFVYVDSGGLLKDENVQKFCERLLVRVHSSRKEINSVLFLNDEFEGMPYIIEMEEDGIPKIRSLSTSEVKSKTTSGSTITVISERYETGTDIAQRPTAKAMVSIRKDMTLDRALQSFFRMRLILKDQNLCIVLSDDVKQHLEQTVQKYISIEGPQKISSEDVWWYLNINESIVERRDNWRAAQQRMREVLEKILRQFFFNTAIPIKERLTLFKRLNGFLVERPCTSPYEMMRQGGSKRGVREVFDCKKKELFDVFNRIKSSKYLEAAFRDAYKKECTEKRDLGPVLADLMEKCFVEAIMPKYVDATSTKVPEHELENEKEQESQQQKEQQLEIEVDISKSVPKTEMRKDFVHELGDLFKPASFSSDTSRRDSILEVLPKDVKKLFGEHVQNVGYSENLFVKRKMLDTSEHADYYLGARWLVVIEDPDVSSNKKFFLVSHSDAQEVLVLMPNRYQIPLRARVTLMTLSGMTLASTSPLDEGLKNLPNLPDVKRIRLLCRVLGGEVEFSKEEVEDIVRTLFPRMDKDKEDLKKFKAFYEGMLKFLPDAAKKYSSSFMQEKLIVLV